MANIAWRANWFPYYPFSITPLSPYSNHPISKLLFSIVMVATAFGYKRFRTYIQALMIFYLATFLIGGTLIGAHYFIQFDFDLSSSVLLASIKGFGDPISWLFVLLGFPIVWYFSRRNLEGMEVTKIQYEQIIDVIFQIGEKNFLSRVWWIVVIKYMIPFPAFQ
ncbi:sigma-E processing peptidase SpoIIGA [Niallia circulans]